MRVLKFQKCSVISACLNKLTAYCTVCSSSISVQLKSVMSKLGIIYLKNSILWLRAD